MLCVPVVSSTGKPLMPCHPARARELVRSGRAVRRSDRGLFYVRLLDRADGDVQPEKGGVRKPYGSTHSHGYKRGSLVKHPKWGIAYVGGVLKDRISLHRIADGKRLSQNARPSDCKFLAFNSWRTRLLPGMNAGVSAA